MITFMMTAIKLSTGFEMPVVGLGTWKSKPGQVENAVVTALEAGYRHIDCALVYENEAEVGNALEKSIKKGVVKREDVFITSKLWNTFHRPDLVPQALGQTMRMLKVDYLDLYLIHWPMAFKEEGDLFPKDENGKFIYSDVDIVDTYKAMEELVKKGLVRSIGLSNFNNKQIQRILDNCTIKPANIQVEITAYLPNTRLVEFCQQRGISVTAYSPLGSPDRPWAKPDEKKLMDDQRVKEIAGRVGKTPAQVLLRWLLQRGVIVIPKSVTPEFIVSNLKVHDFQLADADMAKLNDMNANFRCCPFIWVQDHPLYPFHEEY